MIKPGKQNMQKIQRRSADMDLRPVEEYVPPPKDVCENLHMPVPLDDAGLVQMVWAQSVYKGRVVDFSVEVQRREHVIADWSTVYRIDSKHGEVHEHRFRPEGVRVVLERIPLEDSWKFVDDWFNRALTMCEDEWADR